MNDFVSPLTIRPIWNKKSEASRTNFWVEAKTPSRDEPIGIAHFFVNDQGKRDADVELRAMADLMISAPALQFENEQLRLEVARLNLQLLSNQKATS
jgi:hypothetical protein